MVEDLAPAGRDKKDPADAIPGSSAKPQVTKTGDSWNLDRHRVCCGDARVETVYPTLMQTQCARAVFTDAPYPKATSQYVPGFWKIRQPEFPIASGEANRAEFTTFLTAVFTFLARHSADGALQYICTDWRHSPELLAAAQQAYTDFKDLCIWVRGATNQGSLYRGQHELIFVFKSGKGLNRNNIQIGQSGSRRTNVWKYRPVKSIARRKDGNDLSEPRPTTKPVELVVDAILDCTELGDIVLDPFLGSGTTVIAAERTGRACYGIEIDPLCVDAIVRRWQKFTGLEAVHQGTGQTFAQREKETPDAQQG
jgi:DNA modification methylase